MQCAKKVSTKMMCGIKTLVVAALSIALIVSTAKAQQPNTGSGSGRKHHEQKTNTTAPTTPKADEKAYNAALKSLPNKPYDPWAGTR
jgi:hypothetical protein